MSSGAKTHTHRHREEADWRQETRDQTLTLTGEVERASGAEREDGDVEERERTIEEARGVVEKERRRTTLASLRSHRREKAAARQCSVYFLPDFSLFFPEKPLSSFRMQRPVETEGEGERVRRATTTAKKCIYISISKPSRERERGREKERGTTCNSSHTDRVKEEMKEAREMWRREKERAKVSKRGVERG